MVAICSGTEHAKYDIMRAIFSPSISLLVYLAKSSRLLLVFGKTVTSVKLLSLDLFWAERWNNFTKGPEETRASTVESKPTS